MRTEMNVMHQQQTDESESVRRSATEMKDTQLVPCARNFWK